MEGASFGISTATEADDEGMPVFGDVRSYLLGMKKTKKTKNVSIATTRPRNRI